MLRSLRARLLLWVSLVVLAAVVAVGLVSSVGTRWEFEEFLRVEAIEGAVSFDLEGLAGRLQEHHGRRGWDGAGDLLAERARDLGGGRQLLLLGMDGRTLFTTAPAEDRGRVRRLPDGALEVTRQERQGAEVQAVVRGPETTLHDALGQPIGTLHVLPAIPDHPPGTPAGPAVFLKSVNRWVLLTVAACGLLSLLATAMVGRRILAPVEQLTAAARGMGTGDLTQRVVVTSRDEVGELARTFNTMAESLERQEQLRRQLVTDVAHDLRTPLTNIRGQLEALQDGLLEPTAEVLASLHEEVMFLSRLVVDLQDLSLAEAGKLRLEPRPFAVSEEAGQVVAMLRPPAAGGPELRAELPDLPPALADPARFRQIVHNLLSNAWTHTPADGSILVQARDAGAEIEVLVQDTGPGIEPEHLPHVFERFYRGDSSRARRSGGAGLGLAIVKHLVTVQGGRVWAESRPGQGSSFFFTVPKAPRGAP